MQKFAFTIVVCFAFVFTYAQKQTLNGTWAFKTDPDGVGEEKAWFAEGLSLATWDSMPVPGNWDLRNAYASYAGKAWYRTTFSAQSAESIRLVFEGVYHDSKVWLNGRLLGGSNTGFLPFEFDIAKLIKSGGSNTLVVCTDNTLRRGALWNWGGIRRPVSLQYSTGPRLLNQHISSSVDLQKKSAVVHLEVFTNSNTAIDGSVSITNKSGYKKLVSFKAAAGDSVRTQLTINISGRDFHLWNCDDPFLYTSVASLTNGATHSDRFGIRKVEVDNKNFVFKLNGEPMRVMGFNLVPDDRTTGSTLPAWRYKEDIDLMKSMGANLARLTHLPMPKDMLDYLDEKGIMIFAEVPLWGYDELANKNNPKAFGWLKHLVDQQFNHPSIIGWSVGNEIGYVPGILDYIQAAVKYAKELDSTRLAVAVSHTAEQSPKDPVTYSDMGLINRYGTALGTQTDKIHAVHPDKLLFLTEYGYGQIEENLNVDLNAKAMFDSMRGRQYLMGGALWTFNDYRSAYAGTKEYSGNRAWGIVDVFRQKKRAWYSFKKEYAPIKDLSIKADGNGGATISFQPREKLDLPAYNLHGYTLVWKACNADGSIRQGGFVKLKDIYPGDAKQEITVKYPAGASRVEICLLSPLQYNVCDTTLYLVKPEAPEVIYASGFRTKMNDRRQNTGQVKVVFKTSADVAGYKLKYGKGQLSNETPLTLNSFISVPNLAFGEDYQVALVAVNAAGESEPSKTQTVNISSLYPPPTIVYTEPADKGFYIGFPVEEDDYQFQYHYTTKKGDYSNSKVFQTAARGVIFAEALENGKQYYYQLRRYKQNNTITPWSEEIAVTPDGGLAPAAPVVSGIIRQGSDAIICFTPSKKATGYVIEYRTGNGEWKKDISTASQINHVMISALNSKSKYEFRMAATNENGQSDYSTPISQ